MSATFARRFWIQIALVAVAAVWGATFVVVQDAVESYPVYSFLGIRFAIAVAVLAVVFPAALRRVDVMLLRDGVVAGLLLCAGYIFQTLGLTATTASKAAFITGMFVIITPLLQALLLRTMPRSHTVVGALVAFVGLWLLSGSGAGGLNGGDALVLLCAIAYSVHMIVLGGPGRRHDSIALTIVQLITTSLVCGALALATEPLSIPRGADLWFALVVTGVLATAAAFVVQTYAQRHIPPARTALILISEPAFGGLFGWLAGDALGLGGLAGAVLILVGMIAAEVVGAAVDAREGIALETSLEGPSVALREEGDT